MHHFENGSELRSGHSAHSARHHRRAKVTGADEATARQVRAARPGKPHTGHASQARRLESTDLTQPLGRAQRRPIGEPGGSRDLPGLMQSWQGDQQVVAAATAPEASVRSLRDWQVPASRRPLDGHLGIADGRAEQADRQVLAMVNGSSSAADRNYRKVADGLAIAPRVSVVLPVMNEAANLPGVFATLPSWVHEIVLVDGRSTDGTIAVARQLRPDVKVVYQGGVGKGDALAAGFAAAVGDIIVAIDGDGSTDGHEIVRFVSALLAGADFAKGSRFNSAGASDDITAIRRYGNKALNVTVNVLFGTSFSDLCYGYNAFWADHLDKLDLDSPGFEIETLMSIRAAQAGLRIYEVPSHERLRQHGASNLSAVKDGWRILKLIAQEKRESRKRKARKPKPFMAPGILARTEANRHGVDGHAPDGTWIDGIVTGRSGLGHR